MEVIRKIAEALVDQDEDTLTGGDLKPIAIERVFGIELLPAPFVVAHLQLGLLRRDLGAPRPTRTMSGSGCT